MGGCEGECKLVHPGLVAVGTGAGGTVLRLVLAGRAFTPSSFSKATGMACSFGYGGDDI